MFDMPLVFIYFKYLFAGQIKKDCLKKFPFGERSKRTIVFIPSPSLLQNVKRPNICFRWSIVFAGSQNITHDLWSQISANFNISLKNPRRGSLLVITSSRKGLMALYKLLIYFSVSCKWQFQLLRWPKTRQQKNHVNP